MKERFVLAVTGGRAYNDVAMVRTSLDRIVSWMPHMHIVLIHGDATGADKLAKEWAELRGIDQTAYPVDWKKHGPAGGPIRNSEMAKVANGLAAFPGGTGTADMTRKCRAAGLTVWTFG